MRLLRWPKGFVKSDYNLCFVIAQTFPSATTVGVRIVAGCLLLGQADCKNLSLDFSQMLERAMGIEPTYEAWEASVLPLNYARSL